MRILLVNYEYPPFGGGAGIAMHALAHGLARRGVEVEVLTAASGATDAGPTPGPRVHGVRTVRRGVHQSGMLGAAGFVRAAWTEIGRLLQTGRFDLAHFYFSLPTGALLPVARRHGVPTVVSLRGSDVPGYDTESWGLVAMHRALRPLTRWIWRNTDEVVAVCESLGQLARRSDPTLSFSVVGNGVDIDVFRPPKEPRSTRSGALRCLAVSRLVPRKNLETLLRGFSLLPRGDFQLEVVGSGSEEVALRSLADQLGLAEDVEFAGAVGHEELASRYQRADLFTLVPHSEAYGNVFAEALAAGLPIVGSDVGGVLDLVTHGENGFLVSPGDPEAVVRAIRYLANHPQLRAQMESRNSWKAKSFLSSHDVPDRYLAVYRSVLARRNGRGQKAEAASR